MRPRAETSKQEGGMQKLEIGNNVYLYSMPVVLVGTIIE
jgi:hypothetical protein